MARLTRKTSKLFAENATATNIGQFGSLNAGTKVETNDIDTIQALPAWGDGWEAAGLGQNCYPTLQERNGLDYVQSYMTNYLYQEGVPEWDNNTTYYIGSLVKLINGTDVQLYQSIVDNNTASLSDSTAWTAWGFADKTLSNITAIDNNAQTLLNVIYANKDVAVMHTQNTAAGTTSRPIYVTSSGVATACSGIDVTNLCCTTKPTTSSTASTTKPAVVVENYYNSSAHTWYRIWSDRFCEQGGSMISFSEQNQTVSLIKTYPSASSYTAFVLNIYDSKASTGSAYSTTINGQFSSYFYVYLYASPKNYFNWYACGYLS